MKLSSISKTTLNAYSTWNDHFLVIPPCRFVVFGEGTDARLRSVVADGMVDEVFDEPAAYSFDSLKAGEYVSTSVKFNPAKKVGFLDDLLDAPEVAVFFLPREVMKEIRKADARQFTHARFFRKSCDVVKARIFDARKYYSNAIGADDVDAHIEISLGTETGAPFYFYSELAALKKLPLDDYEVSVMNNELVTMTGIEAGISYHMRDQRLGAHLETRLETIDDGGELFFSDPNRMAPTKSDWSNPRFQRK